MSLGEFLPTPNTLNYFKFNGNSNNSIGNVSSTDSNITYVSGRYGQCANFNGSNSKILANTGPKLDTFTLSMWVKSTATIGGYLFSQGNNSNSAFDFSIGSEGDFGAVLWANATLGSKEVRTNKGYNDGKWHNVITTRNGSTVYLYVDGEYNNKKIDMHTFTVENTYKIMGAHISGVNWLNGQIDEIIVENKVWSENEVRKYYTNSLGRYAIL